jgi:hypothetical protein
MKVLYDKKTDATLSPFLLGSLGSRKRVGG